MPTGMSSLHYPEQPAPKHPLELDNSYYLVRLHDAQAFFDAGWLIRPGALTFSSSVASSFQPGQPLQSLHRITTLQKNIPCQLGVSVNLTDWLPARPTDSVSITLKYAVVQDRPFNEVVDQMGRLGLVAKLALVQPELAVAVKVSEIVGRLLGYLLGEGSDRQLFALKLDLNLATLKSGYYVVVGSHTEESWPTALNIDGNGRLTDSRGRLLERLSYAVLEVLTLQRRGEEVARGESWWDLLEAGQEQALSADPNDDQERRKALDEWRATLARVRRLARKNHGYLKGEIDELILVAHNEVQKSLLPTTRAESWAADGLPAEWQELLGVPSERRLQQSLRAYQEAIHHSRRLLKEYDLPEG